MFTIFACPKPFQGHFGLIQRNALASWVRLQGPAHVLLIGDDLGCAEAANEAGVHHRPEVQRNERGTPLVNSIFALARESALPEDTHLCYVNADIILLPDFKAAVRDALTVSEELFLFGRRVDIDIREPLGESPNWDGQLLEEVRLRGRKSGPSAMDYFVFPRSAFPSLPPFAVGRPGWDQWLAYEARRTGLMRVDITSRVTAIHQQHDYSHHPDAARGVWKGPEAAQHAELLGGFFRGYSHAHTTRDAEYVMRGARLVRNRNVFARAYRLIIDAAESRRSVRPLVSALLRVRTRLRGGWGTDQSP